MSWWKWSKEFSRFEWRLHVLRSVSALVGGDWTPVSPYDMTPPGRSKMLIGSENVPGKSESFWIEVEMLDSNNEPLPPPGSGLPWKTMDSEHGQSGVNFTCQIVDLDARRTFAKDDSLSTPYEVADFARTAIQSYFGDSDDEQDTPDPAPSPDDLEQLTPEEEPALVAAGSKPQFFRRRLRHSTPPAPLRQRKD